MKTKTIRRISAIISALGFLLMLTETVDGGPWAGTFIGLALFAGGIVAMRRTGLE